MRPYRSRYRVENAKITNNSIDSGLQHTGQGSGMQCACQALSATLALNVTWIASLSKADLSLVSLPSPAAP